MTTSTKDHEIPLVLRGESFGEPAAEDEGAEDDVLIGYKAFKEFPFHALYPTLAEMSLERGKAHKANPAMFALYSLSIIAGCLGRARVIRINETWWEPSAIFSCIIGDSTSKKSVMLRDAVEPAMKFDAELDAKSEEVFRIHDDLVAAYEAWKPGKESGERPGRPIEPHDQVLIADDVTMEAVGKWLQMNPRGLLFSFEELMEFFLSMGRYNNGDGSMEQRFWIGMFDGASKSSLRTKNRRRTRYLRLGSVTGGMTPSDWKDVAAPRAFANGMIGRILPIYPSKVPQAGSYAPPSASVTRRYHELIRNVALLNREGTSGKNWMPVEMLFTANAQRVWDEWREMWEARVEDAYGELRTLLARMKTYCARFALISSVCGSIETCGPNVVEADDVRNAAILADWFAEEAERVYAMGQLEGADLKSARLLERLRDRFGERIPRDQWFSTTVRELRHSNQQFWGTSSEAMRLLDNLCGTLDNPGPLVAVEGRAKSFRYFLREKRS